MELRFYGKLKTTTEGEMPMGATIETLRAELERARQAARAGDLTAVLRELDQAVASLDDDRLLTTTEAARLLGIRSPNTVLAWCRTAYIRGLKRGGRTMIPLSEVERIREEEPVRAIKASDQLHDRSATPAGEVELTDEELEQLHTARPGRLPWERAREATG
jgi:hypothetical protein